MEIQLIIRAPNQNIDDQAINCNIDWTVLKLKTHLSEVYPSHPVRFVHNISLIIILIIVKMSFDYIVTDNLCIISGYT